ncbi:hypothetical protein Dsin_005597 [Dipteronia sinensis]|uniref:RNase H type-1 domain-containing protein n=1 Tax=Dipteronia sinensis TaxID=43782 RepID=A0AAE0AXV1_9ROSI|nr:hypothetical protein Dsin_005597 [Dipteronia sinensis]
MGSSMLDRLERAQTIRSLPLIRILILFGVVTTLRRIVEIARYSITRKLQLSKRLIWSVLWNPPVEGVLKFNVDGSALGSLDPARMGGVLRHSTGKVLCLFSYFLGIQDSIIAKIMAIHKACDIVQSSSFWCGCKVVISSDSKVAVSWVNSGAFGNLIHVDTIYEIHNWLRLLVNTDVVYISRVSNSFAYSLARQGLGNCGDLGIMCA